MFVAKSDILPYRPYNSMEAGKIIKSGFTRRLIGDLLVSDATVNHTGQHAGPGTRFCGTDYRHNRLAEATGLSHV